MVSDYPMDPVDRGGKVLGTVDPDYPLTRRSGQRLDNERETDCPGCLLGRRLIWLQRHKAGLRHLGRFETVSQKEFVPGGPGCIGGVGGKPECGSCQRCDHDPGVVRSHHTVEGDLVSHLRYGVSRALRVRAVDVEVSVTHVERRRVL